MIYLQMLLGQLARVPELSQKTLCNFISQNQNVNRESALNKLLAGYFLHNWCSVVIAVYIGLWCYFLLMKGFSSI